MNRALVLGTIFGTFFAFSLFAGEDYDPANDIYFTLLHQDYVSEKEWTSIDELYTFEKPAHLGRLFHPGVPGNIICRLLLAGPPVKIVTPGQFKKTKHVHFWFHGSLIQSRQNTFVKSITCSEPDKGLASQIILEKLKNPDDKVRHGVISKMLAIHPDLVSLLDHID